MSSQIAPSKCPECGSAAYIGMTDVECTGLHCRHYHEQTKIDYLLEQYGQEELKIPDTIGLDLWEDETDPIGYAAFRHFLPPKKTT